MLAVVKLLRRSPMSGLLASPAHLEKAAWSGLERFYTSSSSSDEEEDESAGPSGRRDAEWEARYARAQAQTMALLSAAMDDVEGEESQAVVEVWEEDQKSLRIGVVGSPNVGKSTLTKYLVGSKVSAVSRKENTAHKEHMGFLTKGDSQLLAVPNVKVIATDTQCGRRTSVPGSKSVTRPVLGEDEPKIRQPSAFRRTQLLEALVPRIGHVHYSSGSSAAREEVVIAMGSNVGDRIANFNRALELMRAAGIQVIRHASLYESAPAYVTNQPFFLNSAVSALTNLDPHSLLKTLKDIESELGRTFGGIRYGPRPLDLDIIFYGDRTVTTENLEIPHARFLERSFVLAPLADLLNESYSGSASHWSNHKCCDGGVGLAWEKMGGESCIGKEDLRRVIPIGEELLDWSAKTYVMGILNVTPDSFSDGGRFLAVENAAAHARSMVDEGADFIDIGAQSTRPGATRLSTEEELSRLVPVLEALIADPALKGVKLSVDTFDARVGREAVNMGVHVINDVSGGYLDPEMLPTVADLKVPYIMMHMRGDPTNMQSKANTSYNNVCEEVGQELNAQVRKAEALGVPAWRIITDPGVGFAKTGEQNLNLLKDLPIVRRVLSQSSFTVSRGPMLVGPSRKGFLGKITGREKGEDRDAATVAASVVSVLGGANIIRAHNVRAVRDAMKVVDAIYKEPSSRAPPILA